MKDNLKILYVGDVSAKSGRNTVKQLLPKLKQQLNPDFVVANVENSAGGVGVTEEKITEITSYGVDLCTGGDHTFRVSKFYEELNSNLPFIRPANYEDHYLPGSTYEIVDLGSKGRVAFMTILGRELFGKTIKVDNPFTFLDEFLETPAIKSANIRILEVHAESTAEKLSIAWYVRDRVDAVLGTHTHVPTADNKVFGDEKGKILYVTDIGQVGPEHASLWVDFTSAIHNFKHENRVKQEPMLMGPMLFNSVLLEFEKDRGIYTPLNITRVDRRIS